MNERVKKPESKLRKLRKSRGLTQMEVAEKLGVDQSAISCWERGLYSPTKANLKAMSDLYGCTDQEIAEVMS